MNEDWKPDVVVPFGGGLHYIENNFAYTHIFGRGTCRRVVLPEFDDVGRGVAEGLGLLINLDGTNYRMRPK